ncbi:MAG TPA: hypothetical protein VHE34_26040 [Puia sp.]|uniref:hypothetical protein n=1 Tax=Puia sp. TaxID=2045100 RepID=UPI002BCF67FD|nr:hypothetical protein [Puia sp.]HVU98721.1 hypothetical protein [Puia sp.]
MATSPIKLSTHAFPQSFDGTNILVNVLVIPREDPLSPLVAGAPAFADAKIALAARIIPSLALMPDPVNATAPIPLAIVSPGNTRPFFEKLSTSFNITKPSNIYVPAKATDILQKYLPNSYRNSFAFSRPRIPNAKTDDSYMCDMTKKDGSLPPPKYSNGDVSWGKVFALALRQPVLARELGFIYQTQFAVPATAFDAGGWLYIDLDATSDYYTQVIATPAMFKQYAARIPALPTARPLFGAVQFPVSSTPVPGNFDNVFSEAEDYDDGFAKIVHSVQPVSANLLLEPGQESNGLPPVRDFGIRLGWDDEQILIWQNRQLTIDPMVGDRLDAPMGVLSYRVDVRQTGQDDNSWNSLCRVSGDLTLSGIDVGNIDGELGIEVAPTQLDGQNTGVFWLPSYYTQWQGTSLVVKELKAAKISGTDTISTRQMNAVGDENVPLVYGGSYDFRVRLADISGGGPLPTDHPVYDAPAPFATSRFRRYIVPRLPRIPGLLNDVAPVTPPMSYNIYRPLLGFPSFLYTGYPDAYNLLVADLPAAKTEQREPGYPDPDVTMMQIDVLVRSPHLDTLGSPNGKESFYFLYTVTRSFPDDPTQPFVLDVNYVDAHVIKFGDASDLGDLPLTVEGGALQLPTARDICIRVRSVCKADPTLAYFGSDATRTGSPISIYTRAESKDETGLFAGNLPGKEFQSIMLQPDPYPSNNLLRVLVASGQQNDSAASLVQRLGNQLDLDVNGTTLMGKPGKRVVFGCSKGFHHTLAPDGGGITFSSTTDLAGRWIATIMLEIKRDWSWDALDNESFVVRRDGTEVGVVDVIDTVSMTALTNPDRSNMTIIFFDAVDPKPVNGAFPTTIDLDYTVEPAFKSIPVNVDPVKELTMTVPVAVPPSQVPEIKSAGIALTPYTYADDYSSTGDRQRVLWIELAEPVANPVDDYFVFVKAYSPDPILIPGQNPVPDPLENVPFISPELIRVITPGQSDDSAGLNARQLMLQSTDSPTHFMVPLPPGLDQSSKELFGFFTYELCVGHSRIWSTAQGRFGRPIRITGVQHPAPALTCTISRNSTSVIMSAPYANPVYEGKSLLNNNPQTEIWGALYTQVMQADGASWRNILLGEKRMYPGKRDTLGNKIGAAEDLYGICAWSNDEISATLEAMGLPDDSPLSVLAIELFRNRLAVPEPIGSGLGKERIYRTSRLEPVPMICCC